MLTAGELGERLEVSPAAISGAVRYLVRIGMLQRVPAAGSRRDRYRLPVDLATSGLRGAQSTWASWPRSPPAAIAALGVGPAAERVARMGPDFFLFMQREMDGLLARWRAERP